MGRHHPMTAEEADDHWTEHGDLSPAEVLAEDDDRKTQADSEPSQ